MSPLPATRSYEAQVTQQKRRMVAILMSLAATYQEWMHFSSSTGNAATNEAWEWQFPWSCVAESRPCLEMSCRQQLCKTKRGHAVRAWANSGVNIGGSNWRTTQQGISYILDPCGCYVNILAFDFLSWKVPKLAELLMIHCLKYFMGWDLND